MVKKKQRWPRRSLSSSVAAFLHCMHLYQRFSIKDWLGGLLTTTMAVISLSTCLCNCVVSLLGQSQLISDHHHVHKSIYLSLVSTSLLGSLMGMI